MKLSFQWLNQWANTTLTAVQAGETLTLAGLELDGLESAAEPLDGVVVGEILHAEKHPDADRLQICSVNIGQNEALQIVCGAPNARAGIKVAVATVGTRLPGDFRIKKSKIRGAASFGMLCSGGELGLTETPGILELPSDFGIGQPLYQALGLDDSVLEIALTPNRGDCFSVRGVARDLACLAGTECTPPYARDEVPCTIEDTLAVQIESAADCSNYAGRIIRGLNREAKTPMWMQERLRRADLRSINPLVDVTNYVMLELGQPMHAFDLNRLSGNIEVRRARDGESLTLLNDQAITLSACDLLVTDANGPVALAGAMGGLDSAVDDTTVDIFLESACFSPAAVAGTGRRFKLSSDSLQRFERGVDPTLQREALERASSLLIEIAGGQAGPVTHSLARPWSGAAKPVRVSRVQKLLGASISGERMVEILRSLECTVEQTRDDELMVSAPSHRYDLSEEIDYVEEIARIHGYDRLPGRPRKVALTLSSPDITDDADRLRAELVARGYFEAFSFSFAEGAADAALNGDETLAPVRLDNPMSNWMQQMRRTIWASLLPVWKHNVQRQQQRIRLFEIGRQYGLRQQDEGDALEEREVVAGLISGLALPEQWGSSKRTVDFYDLKADVTALLGDLADKVRFSAQDPHPALHPGRSARIMLDDVCVGELGQLHPELQKRLDLPGCPLLFRLDLALWKRRGSIGLQSMTTTPSSRRDIALVIDQSLEVDKLIQYVKSHAGPLLRETRVFDVFTGEALPDGCKSVALGLIFQDFSRTLTDEEVDQVISELTRGLENTFGAQIRD